MLPNGTVPFGSKYCFEEENGDIDNQSILDLSDDAANYIMGEGWQIPSANDFNELLSSRNCDKRCGPGINAQETLLQCFHLHLPHRFGCSHQLAVDIGDADTVAIHDGQIPYTTAHKALGAPRTNAANAEDNHPFLSDPRHYFVTQKQF